MLSRAGFRCQTQCHSNAFRWVHVLNNNLGKRVLQANATGYNTHNTSHQCGFFLCLRQLPQTSPSVINYLRKCEELHTNLHLICVKKYTNDVDKYLIFNYYYRESYHVSDSYPLSIWCASAECVHLQKWVWPSIESVDPSHSVFQVWHWSLIKGQRSIEW